MAYGEEIFLKAKEIIGRRREKADAMIDAKHSKLASDFPELKELERALAETGQAVVKALDCGSPEEVTEYILSLKKQNLSIQADIAKLIKTAKLPENYLEPVYNCKLCNDTGVKDGKLCSCFIALMKKLSYDELCASSPLEISGFEDFTLDYYPDTFDEKIGISPRKRMGEILEFCKGYAHDFSKNSPNLFFSGFTGLGKTHLSLSIAGVVINKGYGVVYGSAQNLFSLIEEEHFGRRLPNGMSTQTRLLECELLIIDDLGVEFITQFTVSVLYNIVNSRLLSGRPTIINSNCTLNDLENKYTSRITSRIIGEYRQLRFFGRDIRQIK